DPGFRRGDGRKIDLSNPYAIAACHRRACRASCPASNHHARLAGTFAAGEPDGRLSPVMAEGSEELRLLLVEDNARLAEFVVKGLTTSGFIVDRVARLEEAEAALAAARVDAVILDLGLPDGDGAAWLRRRRANGESVPVLMLTARAGTGDK